MPRSKRDWRHYRQEREYAEAIEAARATETVPSLGELAQQAHPISSNDIDDQSRWQDEADDIQVRDPLPAFEYVDGVRLPAEYATWLSTFDPEEQLRRLDAMRQTIPMEDLELLTIPGHEFRTHVEGIAEGIAERQRAANDGVLPETSEARKERFPRSIAQRLRSRARKADLRASSYCGVVGRSVLELGHDGKKHLHVLTPFCSDFTMRDYAARQAAKLERMQEMRLVRRDKPTMQMNLAEVAETAALAAQARLRILLDVEQYRGEMEGLTLTWITITPPAEHVPNAIYEFKRKSKWDINYDFIKSDDAMQQEWARIRALAAKHNTEPCGGLWAAQMHQNGTQHRHLCLWFKTREMARHFCDMMRERYSGQHQCTAYVIGDDDADYAPPKRRDTGEAENVGTVFRYLTRYCHRFAFETDVADKVARHHAAMSGRGRSLAWMGLRDGAGQVWDTCWKNAERALNRNEDGEAQGSWRPCTHSDIRIRTAVDLLAEVKVTTKRIAEMRRTKGHLEQGASDQDQQASELEQTAHELGQEGLTAEDKERIEKALLRWLVSAELKEELTLEDKEKLRKALLRWGAAAKSKAGALREMAGDLPKKIDDLSKIVTRLAYDACLAMGRWRDVTAHEEELITSRFGTTPAPIRVNVDRETMFGETVKKFAGICDSESGEVLPLYLYEWDILGIEDAEKRVAEFEKMAKPIIISDDPVDGDDHRVTDIGTDPRPRPSAPAGTTALPPEEAAKPPEPPPSSAQAA